MGPALPAQNYLATPLNSGTTTPELVDEGPKPYDEVVFKFKYHQTRHEDISQVRKNTVRKRSKHTREVFEKEFPLQLTKDSDPTKGTFCQKCHHTGMKGSSLVLGKGKIHYFGPVFCKCVLKNLYVPEPGEVVTDTPDSAEVTGN